MYLATVAKISWILKDAGNRELDYEHIGRPLLSDAMVELNLIDTQGGGIKRMFETQRQSSFPLPDYDLSDPSQVSVTVSGRILDERSSCARHSLRWLGGT